MEQLQSSYHSYIHIQIKETLSQSLGKLTLQSSSTSGSDNSGIVPNVATNLADELIDHENRKFNLVIRNLLETAEGGGEVDKNHFKSLL